MTMVGTLIILSWRDIEVAGKGGVFIGWVFGPRKRTESWVHQILCAYWSVNDITPFPFSLNVSHTPNSSLFVGPICVVSKERFMSVVCMLSLPVFYSMSNLDQHLRQRGDELQHVSTEGHVCACTMKTASVSLPWWPTPSWYALCFATCNLCCCTLSHPGNEKVCIPLRTRYDEPKLHDGYK